MGLAAGPWWGKGFPRRDLEGTGEQDCGGLRKILRRGERAGEKTLDFCICPTVFMQVLIIMELDQKERIMTQPDRAHHIMRNSALILRQEERRRLTCAFIKSLRLRNDNPPKNLIDF